MRRGPSLELLLGAATIGAVFAAWNASAAYGWVNPLFLPAPHAVWQSFVVVLTKGYQGSTLAEHLLASLGRVLSGYGLACLLGVPLGLAMGGSRWVRGLLDPLIEFYRPLPPLALYTLLVMWLGISDLSKVALLFLAALPPVTLSTVQAVSGIDPLHLRAARSLGAGRGALLREVLLPACLPGICGGLRISLGFTYTVLVAAEIVAAPAGVGWMIWDASKFLLSDVVIMGLFVVGLTGLALDRLLRGLERLVTPWRNH